MIPPVLADYLEVLVGQRVVAGNFPLAHREMCFEEFRPATPDSGGGVAIFESLLTSRPSKVPVQRCPGDV
jgi:hypothetical protein